VVTTPYPVSKPNSNATKYYWGPGTDSVEIVLLSLPGKGHWHSNDDNGVHTSQEIWNFCKNFSLGYGVSKFKFASVIDQNPKQIKVEFTLPIKEMENYEGFMVIVDDVPVAIESIALSDSIHLTINLSDSISKSNEIAVSYSSGNVVSTYEKKLTEFNDKLVENLLAGAAPRIVELTVNENGYVLSAKFNKNMLLPSDISSLVLTAQFNGDLNIPITEFSFLNSDSSTYAFTLAEQVFADYNLTLTYSGNQLVAADSSLVKNFTNQQVTNKSKGLPVQIASGALEANAFTIGLNFTKPMALSDAQLSQLAFSVNGKNVSVKEFFVLNNSIRFVLSGNLFFNDSIKVTYVPGNITAADKGDLEVFSSFVIDNPIPEPTWYSVPGKVEAENYTLQFGTDTETTADTGGGLNVGWTDAGDWLVYAIENNTDETEFELSFRVAAQEASRRFDFYINDVRKGQVTVPNTGGWQSWQSVVRKISLEKGKQYLKLLAVTGGFNINYFDIYEDKTGIGEFLNRDVIVYPNPVSYELFIRNQEFECNKVAIFNTMGVEVLSHKTTGESLMKISIDLPDGLYFVKIENDEYSLIKKIQVVKN